MTFQPSSLDGNGWSPESDADLLALSQPWFPSTPWLMESPSGPAADSLSKELEQFLSVVAQGLKDS